MRVSTTLKRLDPSLYIPSTQALTPISYMHIHQYKETLLNYFMHCHYFLNVSLKINIENIIIKERNNAFFRKRWS